MAWGGSAAQPQGAVGDFCTYNVEPAELYVQCDLMTQFGRVKRTPRTPFRPPFLDLPDRPDIEEIT